MIFPTSEGNFGDPVTFPPQVRDRLQVDHKRQHQSTRVRGAKFTPLRLQKKGRLEPLWRKKKICGNLDEGGEGEPLLATRQKNVCPYRHQVAGGECLLEEEPVN